LSCDDLLAQDHHDAGIARQSLVGPQDRQRDGALLQQRVVFREARRRDRQQTHPGPVRFEHAGERGERARVGAAFLPDRDAQRDRSREIRQGEPAGGEQDEHDRQADIESARQREHRSPEHRRQSRFPNCGQWRLRVGATTYRLAALRRNLRAPMGLLP
jgi:hypothetical protein